MITPLEAKLQSQFINKFSETSSIANKEILYRTNKNKCKRL